MMVPRVFAVLLLALATACGVGTSDDTWVAEVDETQIRYGELRRDLARRAEAQPDARREDLLNDALNQLVSEQVILNRAAEIGVEVLDREIDARLRRLHGADLEIDAAYRDEVRREMTIGRATLFDLADKVTVPETAVATHFEENREEYAQPERVRIRQIVVEERVKADELIKRLAARADFSELAVEHSLAPDARDGGLLPPFAKGELPEAFDQAFAIRKKNGLSKVIESPYGFHIFKLEARLEPREPEYDEVREEIVMELEHKRLAELRREWLRGLRRQASIQVNDALLETLR